MVTPVTNNNAPDTKEEVVVNLESRIADEVEEADHLKAHARYHATHASPYENWDEKPVGAKTAEALIIPIDVPDARARPRQNPNTYAAKKTVAQGMMDIALITANANQLRYLIEFNRNSSTFYLNVTLIVISLLIQVAVGVSLIFKGRFDLRGESKMAHARRINNYVVVGVFLVTIINVFVASFTINAIPPPPPLNFPPTPTVTPAGLQ